MHTLFVWLGILLTSVLIVLVIAKITMSGASQREALPGGISETFDAPPGFDFVLPIYIISLPIRQKTRLDPLLRRIEPDPRYSIVEVHAVDGANDLIDDRETFLSRGQVGCWLSHAYFWKIIAERPEPFALILEDDAMIHLPEMYGELVEVVEGALAHGGWDVIYLGGQYQPRKDGRDVTNRISDKLVQSNREMWFSHAYLITREGASKYLEQSAGFSDKYTLSAFDSVLPLDVWQTVGDRTGVVIYNADPIVVPRSEDGISDTYDAPPPPP